MGFQTTVNVELGFGIPGALYDDGPVRCAPYELNSASAAYNVIGATAFTVTSGDAGTGIASGVVAAGGIGTFAGILANSKVYANIGTTSGPLNSNLTLPNFAIGELLSMGDIVVSLPGPANVGDLVCYDQTTGALSSFPAKTSITAVLATTGVLTVTAVTAGMLQVGQVFTGTGVPGGLTILAAGTGTGNTGTYTTNVVGTAVAAAAMSAPSLPPVAAAFTGAVSTTGVLTVTAITSGELSVGQVLYGSTLSINPVITGLGTGVGGTGTYTINQIPGTAVGATAMTADQQIQIPRAEVYRYAPSGNASGTGNGIGVIKITD
jgi:hypothetical protein